MIDEPKRVARYRKNPEEEERLAEMNRLLAGPENERVERYNRPSEPPVFIIGAPRSGTTLLSQLLSRGTSVGYISNFLARFWLAPGIGAEIERALRVRDDRRNWGGLTSEFGVTLGWAEPHEFGYFWDRWFDIGQPTHTLTDEELQLVDSEGLVRSVASIEAGTGGPVLFKNNTWCSMTASFLASTFDGARFILCERDTRQIGLSILRARRERYGDVQAWWSIRPSNHQRLKTLPWPQQIAGQVTAVCHAIEKGVGGLDGSRLLRVDYRDLCADPIGTVELIARWLGVSADAPRAELPVRLETSDRQPQGAEEEELWETYEKHTRSGSGDHL